MADLGSIGVQLKSFRPANTATPATASVRRVSETGPFGRVYMTTGLTKTVSGQVKVLGVATAGILVRVHAKNNGEVLAQAYTDGSGNYSIKCGTVTDVYVAAFDPTTYQALIYDQVAPG